MAVAIESNVARLTCAGCGARAAICDANPEEIAWLGAQWERRHKPHTREARQQARRQRAQARARQLYLERVGGALRNKWRSPRKCSGCDQPGHDVRNCDARRRYGV